MNSYRSDFPILSRKVNGKTITYLDSGATSQKPQVVIDSLNEFYTTYNANIHRGIYTLSEESTIACDQAREKVKMFINAKSKKEIIFTRNATESINLVAYTWAREHLHEEDEILTTIMEHHANFVPWQVLVRKSNCEMKVVDITDDGLLDFKDFENSLSSKTKLVCITQVSNVLGTVNPVKELVSKVRKISPNAKILVDACQSVPHMKVDVEDLDCDFLAFSGHKMLGPTGIGVLYAKEEILAQMPPFLTGGDMISEVHLSNAKWNDLPYKFEAGTPHISGIIGLETAIDYLNDIGMDNIHSHEKKLVSYAIEKLENIKGIRVVGPSDINKHSGIISFALDNIHPHDISEVLNSENVYIRSGHHCAQPLHERLGIDEGTARASFYIYNDKRDVDRLVEAIEKTTKVFQ